MCGEEGKEEAGGGRKEEAGIIWIIGIGYTYHFIAA
jgi:hypothetical protein